MKFIPWEFQFLRNTATSTQTLISLVLAKKKNCFVLILIKKTSIVGSGKTEVPYAPVIFVKAQKVPKEWISGLLLETICT